MLARRLISPKEKLVKTIEMAAEFGNLPEQRVAGRNLGFMVYYNIDIILLLAVVLISLTSMLLYVLLLSFKYFLFSSKVKTQ